MKMSNWIRDVVFLGCLLWIDSSQAQSQVVGQWEAGDFVLPNNDEWTVLGYLNSLSPNKVHIFGGIRLPKQHYVFDLKSQAVNHFNNIRVGMSCHVQSISLGNRTYVMNDEDRIFYTIDLITFTVEQLARQPRRAVPHVCTAENGTHVFMLGGMDVTTKLGITATQIFNLRTKRWLAVAVPRMITGRYDFGCGIDPNNGGRLYAIGGQVGPNTFTAQIEFISLRNIAVGRWRKFKFSLAQPMALYNSALVPTVIAQGQARRILTFHEVTSESGRISIVRKGRRLQQIPDTCNGRVDTIFVLDNSCGRNLTPFECDRLKNHLLNVMDLYNVSSKTRFGIVGYSDIPTIHLDLMDGDQKGEIIYALSNWECGGNDTSLSSPDLQAGIDVALQMFAVSSDSETLKSMIVYPICSAVDTSQDPPSFPCTTTNHSDVQIEDVMVSVLVSGGFTVADYYRCLVELSKASTSNYAQSQFLLDNPNYDVQQYQANATGLKATHCPLNDLFNFVQIVTTGGFSGGCCPENTTCPEACPNPQSVWSVDVTFDPSDLEDPCIAARYYNGSNIECGVVDSTQSIAQGRAGARMIYYDCSDEGPTLWIFGGRENITSDGAARTFISSDPIEDAYDTCPVVEIPTPPCNGSFPWPKPDSPDHSSSNYHPKNHHSNDDDDW